MHSICFDDGDTFRPTTKILILYVYIFIYIYTSAVKEDICILYYQLVCLFDNDLSLRQRRFNPAV